MTIPITLLASSARVASGVSNTITLPKNLKALIFQLDLTNADTDANDTLNIYIQESIDGTNWNDIASFAQIIGTDSTSKKVAKINCEQEPSSKLATISDGSLAAGTIRQGPVAQYLRAKYTIVDGGSDGDQSFTFGLTMQVIR